MLSKVSKKLFSASSPVTGLGSRMVRFPIPGSTRDFKISVPVAVALIRHWQGSLAMVLVPPQPELAVIPIGVLSLQGGGRGRGC